jgi:hypothetical protein
MAFNDPSRHYSKFGERAVSGSLVQEATACFVTGKAVVPGDVTVMLSDRQFIRVKAEVWSHLGGAEKDAVKAEARSQAQGLTGAAKAVTPPLPDYESLSIDDLRAKATERGIDLEGARTKPAMISKLRFADMQARFADVPAEGEA